jgi:orotidine-5'-phosphate decarboxylase
MEDSMRNFMELLRARWDRGFAVCVGLDSDYNKLPMQHISGPWHERALGPTCSVIEKFNMAIVDATAEFAVAFKPNLAFYSAYGIAGIEALHQTIAYIHVHYPEIPVILDAKVADIGKTNEFYVNAFLRAFMQADAVTVHPYLGQKAMQPFLDQKGKGIFVLCRTSNEGAEEFQDAEVLLSEEEQMTFGVRRMLTYERVATRVHRYWNENGNCGLVVGATYPQELAKVRIRVGNGFPILIPGIGTQGGDLEKTVFAGADSKGQGMIINSSSGIIFASYGPRSGFCRSSTAKTQELHQQIQQILAERSEV